MYLCRIEANKSARVYEVFGGAPMAKRFYPMLGELLGRGAQSHLCEPGVMAIAHTSAEAQRMAYDLMWSRND